MRPSMYKLPSSYLNMDIRTKNERPVTLFNQKKTKQPSISLPRNSIVDTPLNNGLRQPQLRRTSVFMSTPLTTLSDGPSQMNNQRSIIIKNAPLSEMGKIIEEAKKNGKIEAVNQTNNGDIKIVYSSVNDAHKMISNGLMSANGKQYLVNGINQFGEEYGCGDVLQQLVIQPRKTFWDYLLHLVGLK
ncbi:hypothetical protein KM1_168480 [Entamoeba histolytica HM-3:IMSS]|nr:hypothetical protein KM1_168480 [Entamoeba histolytica HM-3:IMSS]GAT95650.1 hypothetical protein CL6EHI_048650 [Entamoeba histolytica]